MHRFETDISSNDVASFESGEAVEAHRHSGCPALAQALFDAVSDRLEGLTTPVPEFATVRAASTHLGIGVKALRGAIQRGELSVYHLGAVKRGRPRVHIPQVRKWALTTAYDPNASARAAGEAAARRNLSQSHGSTARKKR